MQAAFVRSGLWLCALWPCVLATAVPLQAQGTQDAHRIWGRVQTVEGAVHTGFLRWDRNEGSWFDILDGSKHIPEENYEAWLASVRDGEQPTRTVELKGYRISWDEEDPDFPLTASSGVQFGHLLSVVPSGRDSATVVLRSGERLTFFGGSTDIGPSMRDLVVDVPGRSLVELEWEDVARVDFRAAPNGATAASPRLYGVVSDKEGRSFTGYVSWDLDEIFEADTLDGEDEEREDREIEFADIVSIEAHRRSATVTLKSGQTVELSGSNDVDRGNRGVQLSDPTLGQVEIEWEELASVTFMDPPARMGFDSFDGGHPLFGTLTTESGEEVTGLIRWDVDEQWSWEFLDGQSEEVSFKIAFEHIERIERSEVSGAEVTLTDGRTFQLDDSNDVDWDNKGILVAEGPTADAQGPRSWRYVSWDDFREVRFEHPSTSTDSKEERP